MTQKEQTVDIAPLSKERHADLSLDMSDRFAFAKRFSSVPIVLRELGSAVRDLPVFFVKGKDGLQLTALLGFEKGENTHVRADGTWEGRYVPATLRQYPFVLGMIKGQKDALLSIDQAYDGFNVEGRGTPLFDEDGEPTEIVKSARNFAQQFAQSSALTQKFCQEIDALEILDPIVVKAEKPDGQTHELRGLHVVSREKLLALPPEKANELLRTGMLESIFLHLHSLGNMGLASGRSSAPGASANVNGARSPDLRQLG